MPSFHRVKKGKVSGQRSCTKWFPKFPHLSGLGCQINCCRWTGGVLHSEKKDRKRQCERTPQLPTARGAWLTKARSQGCSSCPQDWRRLLPHPARPPAEPADCERGELRQGLLPQRLGSPRPKGRNGNRSLWAAPNSRQRKP